MATDNHIDEQPAVNNEPAPMDQEQTADINDMVNDQLDIPAKEETQPQETQQDKETASKKAVQQQVDQIRSQQQQPEKQQQPEDIQKKILEGYKSDDSERMKAEVESLRRQLFFFQQLHGNEQQQQQFQNQPQQHQQYQPPVQQQAPQQQQQRGPLDDIQVTEDDLLAIASGDVTRAAPVIKKFLGTAAVIAVRDMQQRQVASQRSYAYINACANALYEKYSDLKEYPEIVRAVGNDLGASYDSRGIQKYPHEILDELGERCREVITKFKGQANGGSPSPTIRNGSRQGVVPGTKIPTPTQEKLTDEQKEMYDLFEQT